jgi:hypothetical protein
MGGKKRTNTDNKIKIFFNSQLTRLNMTRKIWKLRLLLNLQSSSFQSFPRLPSSTRSLVIPLQSTLICMEHYSVFPNLGIHFKPTIPLIGKIWKKISLLLPIMTTAKKNSSRSDENWIFRIVQKKAKLHKILSRARARVPKLKVGTV